MLKKSHAYSIFLLLLVLFTSSAAWAATITGNVTNSTGKTGRIFVVAEMVSDQSRSFGTVLETAGGPFTISGVIPETYVVHAFVDTQGTGIQHANDPHGASAELVVGANATNVPAGTIAVATPPVVAPKVPAVTVYGGSGGNYVKWTVVDDPEGLPTADYYTVQWGPGAEERETVRSGYEDNFLHRGGSSSLLYTVTAHTEDSTASSEPIAVVSPSQATGRITGTVSFPVTARGPLFVAAIDEAAKEIRFAAIANPTSPASYTLNFVPQGNYNVVAFLDQNNNGTFDVGDAGMLPTNDYHPQAMVATSQVTVPVIALEAGNAAAVITTGHGKSSTAEWFNLVLTAQSMGKQLVGVTLTGPQLGEPVTLGLRKTGDFHTRIPMAPQSTGDSYRAVLEYSDGSSETVNRQVTGVLTGLPTPVTPVGGLFEIMESPIPIPFSQRPAFSWDAPSPAPAVPYLYTIWLTDMTTGQRVWNAWSLPSSTTSISYGGQNLTQDTTYKWFLNVTDANGNMAVREVSFTPTSSPALSGFTPAGGRAGDPVTILGVNLTTNPAPTVSIGGRAATVTASTSSSITVTVPDGATTGKITVIDNGTPPTTLTSVKDFYVGNPIPITGRVLDSAGSPVENATVAVVEYPGLSDATDAQGNFRLESVYPGQEITLLITEDTFVPTYSVNYVLNTDDNKFFTGTTLDLTLFPFHLYKQAELNDWGVTAGRGMIEGRVMETESKGLVSGATVTTSPVFPVSYYNGTAVAGTSTAANGTFMVFNVPLLPDPGFLTANAQKTGWTFYGGNFVIRPGSVTEGAILGNTSVPSILSFTPRIGKRGDTVTITGVNISGGVSQTAVRFGTVPADVTGVTGNTITVRVPATAITSDIFLTNQGVETSLTNQPFTVMHTLTASVAGAGTVNSNPAAISCAGTTGCTADFPSGSSVTLMASASQGSTFSGWSGACTGTGNCQLTMNSDLSATAIFTSSNSIKVGSNYYGTLEAALAAAPAGTPIQMQAAPFTIGNFTVAKSAKIVGGYNSSFSANTGFTTLFGILTVRSGALRVERIIVR